MGRAEGSVTKSAQYRRIKMGHTPGDLPPEEHKKFPTRGAREVVLKKTRAQVREAGRVETTRELNTSDDKES